MRTFVVLFFVSSIFLSAQNSSLFLPLDVKTAYDDATRSPDGRPGKNYWQNKSEYKIDVEVFTESGLLVGEETIKYFNNSPDTLNRIVFRIYQDISKVGALRDWYIGKNLLTDEVRIDELIIENDTIDVAGGSRMVYRGSTNMIVYLNKLLSPNSNITVKVKWQFKIPDKRKIRMGDYGDGNYFVAYWYPQIAVYDDIDGWDLNDYEGAAEFYNDFSDFDVRINVPAGSVVWATGELKNGSEVLREDIYSKYEQAKASDSTVRIISTEDYKSGLVTSNKEKNNWHFVAKNITDFSFALSKSFNWDGASLIVDSTSGRRALTDVVYKDSTIHYNNAAQYARASVKYLSEELPGSPYPYSHVTSYCNGSLGGGMESPMMANNGAPTDLANHVGLIFHEIAHNYFPFMMGTNERKYAWMDEGWAAFLPSELVDHYDPAYDYLKGRVDSYEFSAGKEAEIPPIIPSYSYKSRFMRTGFYDRPSVAYNELMQLLGRDLFKKAMLEYINRWKGKHPISLDFFNTINEVTNQDLSWFWNPWFYEWGYPDLSVQKVERKGDFILATIQKLGSIPTRVVATFEYKDGSVKTIEKPASIWKDNNNQLEVKIETSKKVKRVIVGDKHIPDSVEDNNIFVYSEQ